MAFRFTIGRKIGTGFGVLLVLTLVAFIFTSLKLTGLSFKDRIDSKLVLRSLCLPFSCWVDWFDVMFNTLNINLWPK